ncbi:MAG: HIT family protein [Capsulimonas sp.]|uniref:HIT family protein n=1 Tax=Capsulimonas sp. TaxID=2494211 RepID=UPI003263E2C1
MPECTLCDLNRGVVTSNDYWIAAINQNQATLGRVFFALRRHETDVAALSPEERDALWEIAGQFKRALATLFAPDHFNFMFLMNQDAHVHMHIYPRYASTREFSEQVFADSNFGGHYDPAETRPLTEAQQETLISCLRRTLAIGD